MAKPSTSSSEAGAPLLAVEEVSKSFGGLRALDEVDLTVGSGEVCGLIGPNGAGKTTLFDIVSGVTPPTSGCIRLDGADVTRQLPEDRARAGVRRTFQRLQLFPGMTVVDNVVTATEWRSGGGGLIGDLLSLPGRRRHEARRRQAAESVLEACGIADLRDRTVGSLTIGQARLVELARAIADQPRLVLLDEPTSGLSEAQADLFGEQIKRLRDQGVGVVLVEHDVKFVMERCDRVVVLNLGRVLAVGTPAEIQSDVAVQEAYLG